MEKLAGRTVEYYEGDVTCPSDLDRVFCLYNFWAVIHFAAIKVTFFNLFHFLSLSSRFFPAYKTATQTFYYFLHFLAQIRPSANRPRSP